jgi:uncharacterized protein DUF6158
MWRTGRDTVLHRGAHAIAAHTHRMLELEFEYIARFKQEDHANPCANAKGVARSRRATIRTPVEVAWGGRFPGSSLNRRGDALCSCSSGREKRSG